jgi:hypothetical protein
MSGVGSFLFGSSPSTTNVNPGVHSTLSGTQSNVMSTLGNELGNLSTLSPTYGQPLTAQLTPQQQQTIGTYTNAGNELAAALPQTLGGLSTAENTLTGIATGSGPNLSQYIQNSVVAPEEQAFSQYTVPTLERAFGQSAGGTHGSDYGQALDQATQNLGQTISADTTNAAYQGYFQNQSNQIGASNLLASDAQLPLNGLSSVLGAQSLVQSNNQAGLTNNYQEFLNTLSQNNASIGQQTNFLGTPTTAANNTIVNPGTPGLVGSLVSSLGSNPAFGSAAAKGIGSLASAAMAAL